MPRPDQSVVVINGPALRFVRIGLGINPGQLAAEVDVSAAYIRKLEGGFTRTVGVEVFARLCHSLRLTDRRVLMALVPDPDTVIVRPHPTAGQVLTLDAPDLDEEGDVSDPDTPDPDDRPVTALAASLAS
jgi:transcriptional regulator with XRE-family HTH domain